MFKWIKKAYTKHLDDLVEKYWQIYKFDMGENHVAYNNECYYKENAHLKAENERLKAFKRECLKPVCFPDIEPEVINKYKQALEEVKDYCEQTIYMPLERQFIIHKINEVLKDE